MAFAISEDLMVGDDGMVRPWPNCEVTGCPNKICLSKGETRFCWPHSGSGMTVSELIERESSKVPVT